MITDLGAQRSGFARNATRSLLLATTVLAAGSPALAQSAGAESNELVLEEIVVTSQKRSENMQDVALAIQAFGNEKLEQLQVTDFYDYAKMLPNLSYATAGPGFSQVYMRGVASGGDGNHSGSLPSVGIYLDEQPITTIQGALDVHVYDIERVEALSGPQGTLYGASSQAGTVRIITNKPDVNEFSAAYDLEVNQVEHGGMGYVGEGYVNKPLSDKAAIRLVGWVKEDAGYIDNVHNVRQYVGRTQFADDNAEYAEDNYNNVSTYGGRLGLRIDLDENWTLTPQLMGQYQKSNGSFAVDPAFGDLKVAHYHPEFQKDKWVQAALTLEGKVGNWDLTYSGSYLRRAIDGESDYADYAYFYDAYYASAYGGGTYFYDNAGDYVNPSQFFRSRDRFSKISQELRLASPAENDVRFVGGFFYQRQSHNIQQRYMIWDIADAITVPNWDNTIWLTKQSRVDRDYAIFGELTWDITEKFSVTGGLRVFKYDNTLVGFFGYSDGWSSRTGVAACAGGIDGPAVVENSPCTNLYDDKIYAETGDVVPRSAKKTGNTYKINMNYHVTDDIMVYGTISRGFRPGGHNRRGTLPPYIPDFLTNYELGWKTTLFDGRVRFNGAIYQQDWTDVQYSLLGANGLTEITNAAQARIKGFEMDATVAVTDGLTVTGSIAHNNARLTENFCGFTDDNGNPVTECASPEAPIGTVLPVTPKFKAAMTARYEWTFGDYNAYGQMVMSHQDRRNSDLRLLERSILGRLPASTEADFSFGVGKDGWTIEAYIHNAFDERTENGRYAACGETICGSGFPDVGAQGIIYNVPTQPRTFGIKFGQEF
ncbi:TonB-dependent receptor [Gimibacter soli]|uniref:TonB-dependent receptor n=1 Tax=Gimibacter soli TaxID=3024400 RepID=A0AAF0BJC6_9PROT|nr:TonB-dependent receptor [Gimibacter soli]WCL52964.1 TonB-dependent receptor [Gimibacter soli]